MSRGTLGILGLVLSAAVMIATAWLLLRTATVTEPPTPRLPSGVPADVGRKPDVARQHVMHEMCTAQCTTDDHTCRGLVIEPSDETRCRDALAACQAACP